MKKVSIIVPVYNVERYLNQCMDSLVNQTLDDIEIIVINDGSTDKSLKILKSYEKKYPDKVKIIEQKNSGISVARNNGIKLASGKYIGFVDSDDYVELDMFEKLYDKIKKSNSDIVVCNYKKYYEDLNEFEYVDVIKNIKGNNLYSDISIINNIDYAPWNKLFRRELFDNIKFPKNVKYEDLSTILKTFMIATKISVVNKSLYLYRINETGETRTINRKVTDILIILKDLIDYSKEIDIFDKTKNELRKLCVNKLFFYLIYSYDLNDKKFSIDFRNKIIKFLKENFNNWQLALLKDKSLEIRLVSKLVLINNYAFKYFINKKIN